MSNGFQKSQILLAIETLQSDPKLTVNRATKIYEIPRTILRHRIKGIIAKPDSWNGRSILITFEEYVIIRYISQLDIRGFSPLKADMEDTANLLLAKRSIRRVGKC